MKEASSLLSKQFVCEVFYPTSESVGMWECSIWYKCTGSLFYSNAGKPSKQYGEQFPLAYPSSNAFDGVWNGLFSHTDFGAPSEVYLSVDLLSVDNVVGLRVFARLLGSDKKILRVAFSIMITFPQSPSCFSVFFITLIMWIR